MNIQTLAPPHERDALIEFDEPTHVYRIQGQSDLVSVTTFVGKLFPPFDADAVIEKMVKSKNWPKSKYFGMSPEEIKATWQGSADLGTRLHADIERTYKGEEVVNDTPEYAQFKEFHAKCVIGVRTPYRSEWRVFTEGVVGTVDMIYQLPDGTYEICDWKRTDKITKMSPWGSAVHPIVEHLPDTNFWHYALQLNLYQFILEKEYGLKISRRFLVCLHPNRDSYEIVPIPELQQDVRLLMDDLLRSKN